jgi:hypothetical protein
MKKKEKTTGATSEAYEQVGQKMKKQDLDDVDDYPDSDETFAFIAGYTSGGFPFGTTWEEIGETPPWVDEVEAKEARDSFPSNE